MKNKTIQLEQQWVKTRSGAWAARGFHYQHLVGSLIAIRQWAGDYPNGILIPEGLEDYHLELTEITVYLQIKSKASGNFSQTKANSVMAEIVEKSDKLEDKNTKCRVLCLEQPVSGKNYTDLSQLEQTLDKKMYTCSAPANDIITTITSHTDCVESVACLIANRIYSDIANAVSANAGNDYDSRVGITPAQTQEIIREIMSATKGSHLDQAISMGLVKTIDLQTELVEEGFYLGVDAKPGHVTSGLILDRPNYINQIKKDFLTAKPTLIEGPSGAGKSALMWLLAHSLKAEMRWFEVSPNATLADANAIVTYLLSRQASQRSPIAIAIDNLTSERVGLWTHMLGALSNKPHYYFVGTIRIEDRALVTNAPEVKFHRISMDEDFATRIWTKLRAENLTEWAHWKEPYEQSHGLLLEYVHILTQGERLETVVAGQISDRQHEDRHNELKILRAVAALNAFGAEVNVRRLCSLIDIEAEAASTALKRLIDEHLVRESRPGVLGGLHKLRSEALASASHDDLIFLRSDTILQTMSAITLESFSDFVLRCFQSELFEEQQLIEHFAEMLSQNADLKLWIGVLTGLGLVSLDRYATILIEILNKHDVKNAQRLTAAMFIVAGSGTSIFDKTTHLKGLQSSITEALQHDVRDFRKDCLNLISDKTQSPDCLSFNNALDFFNSVAPLPNGPAIKVEFHVGIDAEIMPDIKDTATLMSAAYTLSPKIAQSIAQELGGEQRLVEEFKIQTPWVSDVEICETDDGVKVARCKHFRVSDEYQEDAHETVVDTCETLLGICPSVERIDCFAATPTGKELSVNGHTIASKRIGRDGLPPSSLIAWNVSFGHILRARLALANQTSYAFKMLELAKRSEKSFRLFSEKWIRNKNSTLTKAHLEEMNAIISETNNQAYAPVLAPNPNFSSDANGSFVSDTTGALFVGVFGNLSARMVKATNEGANKAVAVYASQLSKQAGEIKDAVLWDIIGTNPSGIFEEIEDRLSNVSAILHELATAESDISIRDLHALTKKGQLNKGILRASRKCRDNAASRMNTKLAKITQALESEGITVIGFEVPNEKRDAPYWPNTKIVLLIEMESFEKQPEHLGRVIEVAKEHINSGRSFCVVPKMYGRVIATSAIVVINGKQFPALEFSEKWGKALATPVSNAPITGLFTKAVAACTALSGIVHCVNFQQLHDEEIDLFNLLLEEFENAEKELLDFATSSDGEIVKECSDYLTDLRNRFVDEREAVENGELTENPICEDSLRAVNGEDVEVINYLSALLVLLAEFEAKIALES